MGAFVCNLENLFFKIFTFSFFQPLTRMFEDYASGKTILQISRDFEKENITNNGKRFIPETIRYYLKNEYYTGICRINNKAYDKIYPQIISQKLFEKVKTKLDANKYGCRKDNHEIFRLKDKIFVTTAIAKCVQFLQYLLMVMLLDITNV